MKRTLALVAVSLLICLVPDVCEDDPAPTTPHTCSYSLCPFKNQAFFFAGCGNCDEGSDCYILDSLHFAMPDKDYDELDSLLFSTTKNTLQ
jgi:hypothetical protein